MTAGIYYVPEAYSIEGSKLMGRNAAGDSFLRGFLTHSQPSDAFWLQVERERDARHFAERATEFGRTEKIKAFKSISLGQAKNPGVVYHPGPGVAQHARMRTAFGHDAWSLCGITHTTSSTYAMDALVNLLVEPLQPWDSLICTSSAVKENVENVLKAQSAYLRERLGATKFVLPQLPVIPLGIHTKDFQFTEKQRHAARIKLGAEEDSLVVLYTGRLSFHAKAHPLSMYHGLETAVKAANKDVILVECGWFANEHIEQAFVEAAAFACPSIRVVRLDGRLAENRTMAWSSADIFCSLSDNIQETFGIVPIEAMAAGLPVVVSDWDGYKDTVRHDIDGFRIPTIGPQPGLGGDLAHRHALGIDSYDRYCGYTSSLIGINAGKLSEAFVRLFESAALRYSMGESGRKRAKEIYDWSSIIKRYEELWDNLRETRKSESNASLKTNRSPAAHLDPTVSFSHYPTKLLDMNTELTLSSSTVMEAMNKLSMLRSLKMVDFAEYIIPSDAEIESIVTNAIAHGPNARVDTLLSDIVEVRRPYALRGITWLVKLGMFNFQ